MISDNDDAAFSEATWDEIGRRVAASDAGLAEHIDGHAALAQVRAGRGLPAVTTSNEDSSTSAALRSQP